MKINKILTKIALSALGMGMLITPSCDFLDVVPPEQVKVNDKMETHDGALGFLYSVYCFSKNDNYSDLPYGNYLSDLNATTDELINPDAWSVDGTGDIGKLLKNTLTASNAAGYWGHNYNGIGQSLLFEKKMAECKVVERGLVSESEAKEWIAESKAMRAYYHFCLLRRYGPIVLLEEQPSLTIAQKDFQGRSHFDYCAEWICRLLDEAAVDLPAKRENAYMGRMTSTACKAIKAQIRLLQASPLWNGSFPYDNFKNKNFETPGYGYELVSHTYEPEKWKTCLADVNAAIEFAENQGGREIYNDTAAYNRKDLTLKELYVPGKVSDDFKKRVWLMRFLHYACEGDGNHEAVLTTMPGGIATQWYAGSPRNFHTKQDGSVTSGWSGQNPTLNAVLRFYTESGNTLETDPGFQAIGESEWYKAAGLTDNADRKRIINLHVGREPRFYAWIAFDGGDFAIKRTDKNYSTATWLTINAINKAKQGFNSATRDNSVTGYWNMKYIPPTRQYDLSAGQSGYSTPSRMLIRLAELYLIRAEANAALGNVEEAIADLNVIRLRAGVPELTPDMITDKMSIMEWVRRERSIEFFAEGKRFFDLRRWCIADKNMSLGMRKGLNALAKENPTEAEFNVPTTLPYTYTWGNKLYLYPIQASDVYANPQLVQNPGY